MLLALTPNPSIDRTLVVPGFRHAEVTRATQRHDAAGGKGLNVARIARTIGLPVLACAPLGGETGQQINILAMNEGIDTCWFWMAEGESRICLLINDLQAHDTLVINEPGPYMSADDWAGFALLVRQQAAAASGVSFSGSLMPGVEQDWFRRLVAELLVDGRTIFIDTSGAPLRTAIDLPVALIKVNAHELGDALGRQITNAEQAVIAGREILERGPQAVIVTLGKDGAIAVDRTGAWIARTEPITVVSPVGSGDAVLTGTVCMLLRGRSLSEALRMGVACGAANALTLGGGVIRPSDLERLLMGSELHAIDDLEDSF
ncbi:MAG: 1-phosphofructokinase family hexose kinase [Roseiflexaceae bacterium]|nr:1-phosphofructokinase family hexose kinase [Roseiflexaceae bacterium]